MSAYDTELQQVALTLSRGQWVSSLVCPQCRGGQSAERSLSMKVEEHGYSYRCHRASCGLKGGTFAYQGTGQEAIVRPPDPYSGDLTYLSGAVQSALSTQYGIHRNILNTYIRDAGEGWYALPVSGPQGTVRGYGIRWPWNTGSPPNGLSKYKLYMHNPQALAMAWYGRMGAHAGSGCSVSQALLVEDQLSALRVYGGYGTRAIALIGTTLNTDKVLELQRSGIKDVVLALDADATAEAFKIAAQWRAAFRSFKVGILDRDLKDMDAVSIKNFLLAHDLEIEDAE